MKKAKEEYESDLDSIYKGKAGKFDAGDKLKTEKDRLKNKM